MTPNDHSRFRTGGALSFVNVYVALGGPNLHTSGWHDAWLCGGPLDAPAFMHAGGTQNHLNEVDSPTRPMSIGHYRDGHFDGVAA